MKILITGSSGFIGGTFGRYAAHAGHQVMGMGRSPNSGANWPGEYALAAYTADKISEIVQRFTPDVLFHAAGTASVGASLTDPLADLHAATVTTANVLEGVRRSGSKPVIVIPSSAAVVGNPPQLPVDERAPVRPISPYGFHKAMIELLASEYAECYGLNLLVCRFFSVYGDAQRRLLVWELYKQLAGPETTVWLDGTGNESRDFLYVEDMVIALLGLIDKVRQNPAGDCLTVNVGSGLETDVSTLANRLRELVAPEKEVRCRGNIRKNDPLRWCADVSRLKTLLPAWRSRSLDEGLTRCVAAWQQEDRLSQHG